MKDDMGIKGEVTVTVIKADGKKKNDKMSNTIDANLKANIATGLWVSTTYGLNSSVFDNDNFSSVTDNESGIVVKSGSNFYETKNTSIGSPSSGSGVKIQSSTRNNSGSTITLSNAYLGRTWNASSNAFDGVAYASATPTTAIADGQQIDLSWEVTIS